MKSNEAKRFLKKNGCTFETHAGGSGHLTVYRQVDDRLLMTQLPMHGSRKEMGKGLWNKILKDLELK